METAVVHLSPSADRARVEKAVLFACNARSLAASVKTSLKSYPGSSHLHFRKAGERGVVEVTYWKDERRLWINIHSNRASHWTTGEMLALKADLEKMLSH